VNILLSVSSALYGAGGKLEHLAQLGEPKPQFQQTDLSKL
jgi:hypothetical protein